MLRDAAAQRNSHQMKLFQPSALCHRAQLLRQFRHAILMAGQAGSRMARQAVGNQFVLFR
jgi:hypothetical protein